MLLTFTQPYTRYPEYHTCFLGCKNNKTNRHGKKREWPEKMRIEKIFRIEPFSAPDGLSRPSFGHFTEHFPTSPKATPYAADSFLKIDLYFYMDHF